MVEYFGEQLAGYAFTQNGWVQSYGSRCVKPPIIYGDVYRPEDMTVRWSSYAQSLTNRPVKGMLTGPVTILQWSFVRNDQPRSTTTYQIALAILDEVQALEKAGIKIIQIDEPAIREGLPLRKADQKDYLNWAVRAFRVSSSNVEDDTQIHTHMCYSEFNNVIEDIAAMDADVITIETSRSQMKLLNAFAGDFKYPNDIGPGVYDIHSPRVPSKDEMVDLLRKAKAVYVLQALDNYPMYLEETMESLSYAPSYDESNTMALCLMGRVHAEQLLDYEQAKRYFQEALVHNVQALEVYPYFIQTLIDMGEYEAAKKTIKFALTLPAMPLTGIWIKKALLFEKMRKYKKALKALKKAKLENVDLDFSSNLKAIEDRIKRKQEIKNGNEKENKKERKNSRK